MKVWNILAYLGLMTIGAITLWQAFSLYRRRATRPLFLYFISLCCFMAHGLLKIIGNYIVQEILSRQGAPLSTGHAVYWILRLVSLPFILSAVFFFNAMLLDWRKRTLSLWAKLALGVLFVAMTVLLFAVGQQDLVHGSLTFSAGFHRLDIALDISLNLVLLAGIALALPNLARLRSNRGPLVFSLVYFALFGIDLLMIDLLGSTSIRCVSEPIFAFGQHLLPLSVLLYFWRMSKQNGVSQPAPSDDFWPIWRQTHGISEREAEIIRLLASGKSYREIEEALFISIKTVKSHVYNIYKKLRINSRWQLLSLIESHRAKEP